MAYWEYWEWCGNGTGIVLYGQGPEASRGMEWDRMGLGWGLGWSFWTRIDRRDGKEIQATRTVLAQQHGQ